MKDLPHHIKKLNRNIIRSARREENEEELPDLPKWPTTPVEAKKRAKQVMKAVRKARAPKKKTPDERNMEMKKGRTPVFDRTNNAKPKRAKASKKKRPRI